MLERNTQQPFWRGQEEVVVTGISCRLPESDNMAEFQKNLMEGVDLITDEPLRWDKGRGFKISITHLNHFNHLNVKLQISPLLGWLWHAAVPIMVDNQ